MSEAEVKHQAKIEEWEEKIQECRSSGETVAEWCRKRGVSTTTYYRWAGEIYGKAKGSRKPSASAAAGRAVFAELPAPGQMAVRHAEQSKVAASIRIGKASVDIYSGAEAELVKALCEVLKGC